MSRFCQFSCSLASINLTFPVFYIELLLIQDHPQYSRSICLEMTWDRSGIVLIKATETVYSAGQINPHAKQRTITPSDRGILIFISSTERF